MHFGKDIISDFLSQEVTNDFIEGPKTGEKKKFSFNSPFCSDSSKKCSMWFQSGFFRCYKTGTDGDLFTFISHIRGISYTESKLWFLKNWFSDIKKIYVHSSADSSDELNDVSIALPEGTEKLSDEKYIQYMHEREITDSEVLDRLFQNKKSRRIIFPVYKNGLLHYYTGRSIIKNPKLRWMDAGISGKSKWFFQRDIGAQNIFLTEGIFDALKIRGGTALLGCWMHEEVENEFVSMNPHRITVVMDNDLPGTEAQLKIMLKLRRRIKNVFFWNWNRDVFKEYKDLGEMPMDLIETETDRSIIKADEAGLLKWGLMNIERFEKEDRKRIKRILKER